ncbi:hypothetical protein ALC56_02258 [Trachymyrmex septentrionalis]|uniref:Uncharacterized protein n=1 Tax=Trachymyrmex septentrionalis TaxID=34720 RepID=A0A195FRT0_9HYME|nr:hypothetical protein ALC56_02258 [Trachymyrmex septentrionalis]
MVPLGKNRADETSREWSELSARDSVPRAASTKREEAKDGERHGWFLVIRTVGRQAVCRDTGIPHYFDRGRRREVVVPCVSLVGSVCCHLDTVLVD